MNRFWPSAAIHAALILIGCGGASTSPNQVPTPIPTQSGLSAVGYVLLTGNPNVGMLSISEYPTGSVSALRTFQEVSGAKIRFDPSGTLWFDAIGEFIGYNPDGSSAGTIFVHGQLLWFDVRGNLYTSGGTNGGPGLDAYSMVSANGSVLSREITTVNGPCSAATDRAGNLYLSTCLLTPNGILYGSVSMYGPSATGNAAPLLTNQIATGPLTVDPSGNVYAVYNGALGIWSGTFTASAPTRTVSIGSNVAVIDLAVDRAGNAYVITEPAPALGGSTATLLYIANGGINPIVLQTGTFWSVAAPIQ